MLLSFSLLQRVELCFDTFVFKKKGKNLMLLLSLYQVWGFLLCLAGTHDIKEEAGRFSPSSCFCLAWHQIESEAKSPR